MKATYVSIFDDSIRCESDCEFDSETKTVTNIATAENSDDADTVDSLTDEFVIVDGKELRDKDGVTFDY